MEQGSRGRSQGGWAGREGRQLRVVPDLCWSLQGRMSRWKCVQSAASHRVGTAPPRGHWPSHCGQQRGRRRVPAGRLRVAPASVRKNLVSKPSSASPPSGREPVSRFRRLHPWARGRDRRPDAAGTAVAGFRFSGCEQLLVLLTALAPRFPRGTPRPHLRESGTHRTLQVPAAPHGI